MADRFDDLFGPRRDPRSAFDDLFGVPKQGEVNDFTPGNEGFRSKRAAPSLKLTEEESRTVGRFKQDAPKRERRPILSTVDDTREVFASGGALAEPVSREERKPKYQSIGKALLAGIDDLQGLSYAGAEAIGEVTGLGGLAQVGYEGRLRNQDEADQYGPRGQFSDIQSVGDAFAWAGQTLGNVAPVAVPAIAGGIAGAAAAPVVGASATVGAAVGAFLPSLVTGVGEVQEGAKRKDPMAEANGWTFAGGTAIAALDSVLPGKIGGKLVEKLGRDAAEEVALRALLRPSAAVRIGREAGQDALIEGLTESVQEAIGEVAASKAADKGIDWESLPERMLEASAAGALFGGVAGGVTGAAVARGERGKARTLGEAVGDPFSDPSTAANAFSPTPGGITPSRGVVPTPDTGPIASGQMEAIKRGAGQLTEDDDKSPLPNDLIAEGKGRAEMDLGGGSDLYSAGTDVLVKRGPDSAGERGKVLGTFEVQDQLGAKQGIRVQMEDGSIYEELLDDIERGGQSVQTLDGGMKVGGPRPAPAPIVDAPLNTKPVVDREPPVRETQSAAPARDQLKARIRQVESGGNDTAKNPLSSARGRYQFIDSTWAALGGDPNKRFDPAEQERLMDKLTDANEAALKRAGNQVTAGNLYLAHFLGAGGAVKALANPNAPVSAAVQKANPFAEGWTNAQLAAWADKKMGGKGAVPPGSRFEIERPELDSKIEFADLKFDEPDFGNALTFATEPEQPKGPSFTEKVEAADKADKPEASVPNYTIVPTDKGVEIAGLTEEQKDAIATVPNITATAGRDGALLFPQKFEPAIRKVLETPAAPAMDGTSAAAAPTATVEAPAAQSITVPPAATYIGREGQEAAASGQPAKSPYVPGTESDTLWAEGYASVSATADPTPKQTALKAKIAAKREEAQSYDALKREGEELSGYPEQTDRRGFFALGYADAKAGRDPVLPSSAPGAAYKRTAKNADLFDPYEEGRQRALTEAQPTEAADFDRQDGLSVVDASNQISKRSREEKLAFTTGAWDVAGRPAAWKNVVGDRDALTADPALAKVYTAGRKAMSEELQRRREKRAAEPTAAAPDASAINAVYRKRADEIADAAYKSGARTGTAENGETWETDERGFVTVKFPKEGYSYKLSGTFKDPIIGNAKGPFYEEPEPFDPVARKRDLQQIIADPKVSLNNLKGIAKKLGVTEEQARGVMQLLASDATTGVRMTKGRPERRNRRGRVIAPAVPSKFVREGTRTKPMSAYEFIIGQGGVRNDEKHDLRNVGGLANYIGLVTKNGMAVDKAGEALWEAGYFAERPTEADVIDALSRDTTGDRVYAMADISEMQRLEEEALRAEDEARGEPEASEGIGLQDSWQIVSDYLTSINAPSMSVEEFGIAAELIDAGWDVWEAVRAASLDYELSKLEELSRVSGNDFYAQEGMAVYEGDYPEPRDGLAPEGVVGPEGVEEAPRGPREGDAAPSRAGEGQAESVTSTAPEHRQVGVDDRELSEVVVSFDEYRAGQEGITSIFDPPAKGEVVKLNDKARVYQKDRGWMTLDEARQEIGRWKQRALEQGQDPATRGANSDKVVLSFFDLSGSWSAPWEEAGYQVYRFDIQDDPELGDVNNFSTEFFNDWFGSFDGLDIYAILSANPCTDFASSGARHFAAKDADGRTVASVKLVQKTLAAIEYFKPAVWAIENPVGRIEKLGGLPPWRLSFDPSALGDPYTKKTLIWGRFNADLPVAPVEPTEGSMMWKKYGGKSLATKNARSVTPEGFSYGFFMANNAADHPAMAIANKFDQLDRSLIEQAVAAGVTDEQITEAVEDFYYQELDYDAANDAIRELLPNDAGTKDGLFAEPEQPKRTMTQAQRAELEARQQQSMARRGGQEAVSDQAGGLFSAERDQSDMFAGATKPVTPTGPIEDFGEVLAGARKDTYAENYKARMDKAAEVDIAAEPLSKSWPEPDYEKLIEEGADPYTVAWVRAARDEIPTKPVSSWKLKGWVENVKLLRGMAEKLLAGDIGAEALRAKMSGEFSRSLRDLQGRLDLYLEVGHAKSLKGITLARHHYTLYRGQENITKWSVEQKAKATAFGNWPREIAVADTREEALAIFKEKLANGGLDKKPKAGPKFEIYSYRSKPGKFFIGVKIGKNTIDLKEFETVKEAREYRVSDEGDAWLKAEVEKFKEIPNERRETNAPRIGENHRQGADVTPQQFSETFGFRGVQFGNYVEGSRRQEDLNEAYDALMDMAGVLGIPPKAISLNGELGLAFGARGKGGKGAAAAHYEPGTVVINLTKRSGAGSLGHEWWHALDNYFARQGGSDGYMTGGARAEAVRPVVAEAFRNVLRTINQTSLKQRSQNLDKRRTKAYWSTDIEMTARAFESYLIARLAESQFSNDYLANIVSENAWPIEDGYPYLVAAEIPAVRAAYDDLFAKIETRETERGVAMGQAMDEPVEPFYSALARYLETTPTKRASAEQWKATLSRAPGVKREELEWTGLLDFLDTQEGAIDKTALIELVERGGIQVEEVELEGGGRGSPAWNAEIERRVDIQLRMDAEYEHPNDPEAQEAYINDPANRAETRSDVEGQMDMEGPVGTTLPQFGTWTSDPSNDTYRELLITLPVGEKGNPKRAPSTHWDQEGVVAHARFMEKTDSEGRRVLFIEEVQSDWHQKGRDEGYEKQLSAADRAALREASDKADEELREASRAVIALASELVEPVTQIGTALRLLEVKSLENVPDDDPLMEQVNWSPEQIAVNERIEAVLEPYREANLRATEARVAWANSRGSGIPDAPFKTTWPALVMKRMIHWAVKNGYERVAWTTGTEQAERYSLDKFIDRVELSVTSGGIADADMGPFTQGLFRAFDKSGREVQQRFVYNASDLYDVIGKELADKLVAQEPKRGRSAGMGTAVRSLEGLDLRTGGEGMRSFYDRNLVNITNDLIKKYGAKVGAIRTYNTQKQFESEEMGLLWARGINPQRTAAEVQAEIDTLKPTIQDAKRRQELNDEFHAIYLLENAGDPHPGFTITPELAKAAAGGFPLFKKDGRVLVRLSPEQEAKAQAELAAELKRLEPKDRIALAASSTLSLADSKWQGQYWHRIIYVALQRSPLPVKTLQHEVIHALRDLRLFTQSEWKLLTDEAWKNSRIRAWAKKNYPNLSLDLQREEAAAEYIAEILNLRYEQRRAAAGKGLVNRLADRLFRFLEAVATTFRKLAGQDTAFAELVKQIESGEIGSRETGFGDPKGMTVSWSPSTFGKKPVGMAADAFYAWFGDSKVVDENGAPLVVYHGTRADFNVFSDEDAPYRGGILAFFSTSRKFAEDYAQGGPVVSAYLKIEQPFDFRKHWREAEDFWEATGGIFDVNERNRILMGLGEDVEIDDPDTELSQEQFVQAVKEGSWDALEAPEFVEWLRQYQDYDGIITLENGAINYAVFDPTQIKSTENRGTWDGSNPDIRASVGESAQISRRNFLKGATAVAGGFMFNGKLYAKPPALMSALESSTEKGIPVNLLLKEIAAGSENAAFRALAKKIMPMVEGVKVRSVAWQTPPGMDTQYGQWIYWGSDSQGVPAEIGDSAHGVFWTAENGQDEIWLAKTNDKQGADGWNERTIIHEALHAAITRYYGFLGIRLPNPVAVLKAEGRDREAFPRSDRAQEAMNEIRSLWKEASDKFAAMDEEVANGADFPLKNVEAGRIANGLGNPDEFIAYAASDPSMQTFLRSLPSGKSDGRNLWQRFVDAIRALFGAATVSRSALDDVLDATNALIDEVRGQAPVPPGRGNLSSKENLKSATGTIGAATPEFSDAATERRWQDATKGVGDGPGILSRAKDFWQSVKEGFSRHWIHLPNDPQFADLMQQLRKWEAADEAALEDTLRQLKELVGKLNVKDMDLLTRKVVLDDLMWDAGQDKQLPFGFTPAKLREELVKIDGQVATNEKVRNAVRQRKLANRRLADQMVAAGVLTADQAQNPAYFRHMVLDYARAEMRNERGNKTAAKGGKIKTPYWAKRMGSSLDINANLLEAEFDWMMKARKDIATARFIEWVKKSNHNIREQLRAQAKADNKAAVNARIMADPDLQAIETKFRQNIARGLALVKAELNNGNLQVPPYLQSAADALQNGTQGEFFPLLSWIMDEKKPGGMGAAMVLSATGKRKAFYKDVLKDKWIDPEDMADLVKRYAPEGYSTWQPRPGQHLFTAKSFSEHVLDLFVDKLASGQKYPGISEEELTAALGQVKSQLVVGGDRYTMVLPTEVVATFDEIGDRRMANIALRTFEVVNGRLKQWMLINPRRFFKYNLNNMIGDVDAIVAGNPSTFLKLGAATKEIYNVWTGKAQPSAAYQEAVERGVFTSGLSVQEIPDLNRLSGFKHLSEGKSLRPDKVTIQAATNLYRALQNATNFREAIFRYAAYLDYKAKIDAGTPQKKIGYGASVPQMVDAVSDPADRAALLARDLIGDYGGISAAGAVLRRYFIPFWSWTEINTKRYWRLTRNAFHMSKTRGVMAGSVIAGGLFARMALVYGMIQLFNMLVFGDEDDELTEQQQRQLHIILGRDEETGEIRTLRVQGAFSDILSTFGFHDAVEGIKRWENGQGTFLQAVRDTVKAPVNRMLTSTNPIFTSPLEMYVIKGKLWPDAFNARPIKDKWRHVLSTLSVENEYDAIAQYAPWVFGEGDRPSRGYLRSWEEAFTYRRDPGEMAYDQARKYAYDWLRNVKDEPGFSREETEKTRAMREYRMALRYGDVDAANDALDRYEANGGTAKSLARSIKDAHPLAPIKVKDRAEFAASLTEEQLDVFREGERWYEQFFLGKPREELPLAAE